MDTVMLQRHIGPPDSPLFGLGEWADDPALADGRFPLIVLSHGTGGSAQIRAGRVTAGQSSSTPDFTHGATWRQPFKNAANRSKSEDRSLEFARLRGRVARGISAMRRVGGIEDVFESRHRA